jgi:hypothetical protein
VKEEEESQGRRRETVRAMQLVAAREKTPTAMMCSCFDD